MTYLKTHAMYLILIGLAIMVGRYYLHEHDARVLAEASMRQSELTVKTLQQQITDNDTRSQQQIAHLLWQRQAVVKSPAAAIRAIPSLETLPLNARPVTAEPTAVMVDVVPLAQTLIDFQTLKVDDTQCRSDLTAEQKIVTQQDAQIKVLTKKRGFWRRLWGYTKTALVAGAIGYGAGKL